MNRPRISVVVATHNRHASLRRLMADLAAQTLFASEYEVILVDDGSEEPAAPKLVGLTTPRNLRSIRRAQGGPAAARHDGVMLSVGQVIVFVDDDMQLEPDFLEAHLRHHKAVEGPRVVLGNILPSEDLASLPLFERYHARQLDRFRDAAAAGTTTLRGVHLCTGNVSMRRTAYLAVGGFNNTLRRSEDRELGVRLEKAGCTFVYEPKAASRHDSDHTDLGVWLRRAYLYGRFDTKIGRLHPDVDNTHPWRFWSLVNPLSRPVIAVAMAAPALGRIMSRVSYAAAAVLDRLHVRKPAVTLTALTYGLEYFRGMREECGTLAQTRAEIRKHELRWGATSGSSVMGAWRNAMAAIRADYEATRRQRLKYHGEVIPAGRIWLDLFRKVGFQTLAAYRLMRFFREARIPLVPQIISRLIRHLYSAEIHWDARIEPGVSIVHGVGLVLSHAAVVGEGCILFHNVTLGENLDPVTGHIGAPRLEANVHVGPGATLLGPITVGEGTKIMASAVLMRSVRARSLVQVPEAQVTSRQPSGGELGGCARSTGSWVPPSVGAGSRPLQHRASMWSRSRTTAEQPTF